MMTSPVIIVSGLGRCGSSLLMQMLVAGGIEPTGGTYPFWEDPRVAKLPNDFTWLLENGGKCVKILHAHKLSPPPEIGAKVIWIDRSLKEQAKSWAKVGKKLYGVNEQPTLAEIRERLVETKPDAKAAVRAAALPGKIMKTRFQRVLEAPRQEAERIAKYLGRELDVPSMVSEVKYRGTVVRDEMLEARLIHERTGRAAEQ